MRISDWSSDVCSSDLVNPHYTTHFTGMTPEESRPLLDFLTDRATMHENIYRHRWQVGDVMLWDNRCAMHYAVRDYDDTMLRSMHRPTAVGDRPVLAARPGRNRLTLEGSRVWVESGSTGRSWMWTVEEKEKKN